MSKTPSVLDHYPDYELTIGIEVHVQLTTKSKIFCSMRKSNRAKLPTPISAIFAPLNRAHCRY